MLITQYVVYLTPGASRVVRASIVSVRHEVPRRHAHVRHAVDDLICMLVIGENLPQYNIPRVSMRCRSSALQLFGRGGCSCMVTCADCVIDVWPKKRSRARRARALTVDIHEGGTGCERRQFDLQARHGYGARTTPCHSGCDLWTATGAAVLAIPKAT